MIVHIKVSVAKENGKWIGHWQSIKCASEVFECGECADQEHLVQANRREELERKLDKALRLSFPKANYIVQHRDGELTGEQN
jgi:hypothetical protein